MDTNKHELEKPRGEFLVYKAEDGTLKLDVRLEEDTVWLTQPLMADLFQTTQQNISQHVLNIFEEEELTLEATHKKYLSVRSEGKREVKRLLDYYNLDAFMTINNRDILDHAGKITHEMAKQLAEKEYDKFSAKRIDNSNNSLSDFDKAVKQIEDSATPRDTTDEHR